MAILEENKQEIYVDIDITYMLFNFNINYLLHDTYKELHYKIEIGFF